MSGPHFLVLKTSRDEERWAAAISGHRGDVLAAAPRDLVRPLEPGTRHTGLVIGRFAHEEDRDRCWTSSRSLADDDGEMVALACAGLPWEGWPGNFVPTIATVDVPDAGAARTFMTIEGTGTDQERMDAYRDIILPMLRERGAYYIAFELGGSVTVLKGAWDEGIFAISRWPSKALAEDFWFCDRYQNTAVPLRTGAGRFDVQIVEGVAG